MVTTCSYNTGMRVVGIRDLKARLSEYVKRARAGEEILVTDRGEVVAELRAPRRLEPDAGAMTALDEMARSGMISMGAPNDPRSYPVMRRLAPDGTAQRLIDEERGE